MGQNEGQKNDGTATAKPVTGGITVSELKEVAVLLYSDIARAYQKRYLCGEASILREQWQILDSHGESDQQGEAGKSVNRK